MLTAYGQFSTNLTTSPNLSNMFYSQSNLPIQECFAEADLVEKMQFESQPVYQFGKWLKKMFDMASSWVSTKALTPEIEYKIDCAIIENDKDALNNLSEFGYKKHINKQIRYHRKLDKKIAYFHNAISKFIESSAKQARASHKPLMIVVGEHHYSVHSAFVEALLLIVAKEEINIKKLFTEANFIFYYNKKGTHIDPLLTSEYLCHILDIEKIFVDFIGVKILESQGSFVAASNPARNIRDNSMVNQINQHPAEPAVFIVGAAHLSHILTHVDLNKKYHVVGINTFPQSIDTSIYKLKNVYHLFHNAGIEDFFNPPESFFSFISQKPQISPKHFIKRICLATRTNQDTCSDWIDRLNEKLAAMNLTESVLKSRTLVSDVVTTDDSNCIITYQNETYFQYGSKNQILSKVVNDPSVSHTEERPCEDPEVQEFMRKKKK